MSRHEGKTEQPTARRLKKARDEGQVPRSQEVAVAASLAGALIVAVAIGPRIWLVWQQNVAALLSVDLSRVAVRHTVAGVALEMIVVAVVPFFAATTIAAVTAGVGQVGIAFRPQLLRPKLSRIAPRAGLDRLRPSKALWELVRTALKLGLLAGAVWSPVLAWTEQVHRGWTLAGGLGATGEIIATVFIRAVAIAAVVAVADFLWNRRRTRRDLRMTKDEVRRELKEQMGDPLVRSRRTERARQLNRNRVLADIGQADVVITNPTHLAVVLKYVPSDPAPRVLTKGADRAAARICAQARRHGVPVLQNKPLARALFRRVRPGDYVPHALFEAVAIVLATVYRRRRSAVAGGLA